MVRSFASSLLIAVVAGACLVAPQDPGRATQPELCDPPLPPDSDPPMSYVDVEDGLYLGGGSPKCETQDREWSSSASFNWIDPQQQLQRRESTRLHRFATQPQGLWCRIGQSIEDQVYDDKTETSYPIALGRARVSLCDLRIEVPNAASFADLEVWLVDARVGVQDRNPEPMLDDAVRVTFAEPGQARVHCEQPLRVVELDDFSSGFAVTLELARNDWPRLQARQLGATLVQQWRVEELAD